MTESRLRMLQSMPIFGGIKEDILEFVMKEADELSIAEGDFVFVENDPGDSMFILETGRVAILKLLNNVYYRLNILTAGDCFGEMSLIDLGCRSASVLAITDCIAVEISNATLFKIYEIDLEQFAIIQMNMGRELSRRLRTASDSLARELIKSNQVPEH